MADLTQSYGTTATTTPQFYTDYLNNVAARGTAGANAAQYVGASPLQTQAFANVAQNVGNYQPALNTAGYNSNVAANTDITITMAVVIMVSLRDGQVTLRIS